MKKIWFALGIVVITILLLLQTRFSVFLQLHSEGYAIKSNTVKSMLLANPDEELETLSTQLYTYNPLDYIYSRAGSYYMGEEEKTQVDLSFPLYINGGAGLYFINNSGTLFDVDYQKADVYEGLSVTHGETYNPGGDRADPIDFLFYSTGNGFFYNLKTITFDEKGVNREVTANSAIYFTESYFAYCEPDGDMMNYQIARYINNDSKVEVNGEELTYHELLVRLGIASDKVAKADSDKTDEEEEEIIMPTPEVKEADEAEEIAAEDTVDADNDDDDKSSDTKKDKEKKSSSSSSSAGSRSSAAAAAGSKKGANAVQTRGEVGRDGTAKGVRPDSLRPDRVNKIVAKPQAIGYIKPTVEFLGVSAGTYRIMLDMKVTDKAQRIDKDRKIQYEFYEIDADGKETLAYRTYSSNTGTVTAGDGRIKPDTKYRVNVYFTYNNEYDEKVTESVKSDIYIKTDPLDMDRLIKIRREVDETTGIVYGSIPYYYDRYMEITNYTYDKASDAESIYGISPDDGMLLIVHKDGDPGEWATLVDSSVINKFKRGMVQDYSSYPNLEPNSHYTYRIEFYDFFGNKFTNVENNTGSFYTSKSKPVGSIKLTKNVIGDVEFKIGVTDPDDSAIKALNATADDDYDLYFVLTTDSLNKITTNELYDEMIKYVNNNNSRVEAVLDAAGNVVSEEGSVHYLYKIPKSQYLKDGKLDFSNLELKNINTVDLNTKYYAYILGDYNLQNNKGDIRHDPLASFNFRSATLSSLGNIYIQTDITNITAHSANILYTLNTTKTNDVLTRLLSDIEFDIDTGKGYEPGTHSKLIFDETMLNNFTGYYHDADGNPQYYNSNEGGTQPATEYSVKSVMMDAKYFDASMKTVGDSCPYYLNSMTDYVITPKIYAWYNGKKYEMKVTLSRTNFKTMREPATVDVKNLLLAGGTLRFDVHIADPDGSITGVSSEKVIMTLYDENRNFVRAIRYTKNQYDDEGNPVYYSEEITGLDPEKHYWLTFIAPDYNEGYDNATYVSNKILLEYYTEDIIDIKGSIKLYGLDKTADKTKLDANLHVNIVDQAMIMSGSNMPYYIRLYRDGVDITSQYNNTSFGDYVLSELQINETNSYIVDKGDHTYKAVLYINYNKKELVLDTLTFTTEDEMITISNAYEFCKYTANNPNGRFCVINDLDFGNSSAIPESEYPAGLTDAEKKYSKVCDLKNEAGDTVSTFNGEIDFQGFTVTFEKSSNSNGWFNNIGPKGELYNLVLECKSTTNSRIYDKGVITNRNYGHIHDIYIHYTGGYNLDNEYYGLVTRYNTVSGIIENFVIHSDMDTGYFPFTIYQHGGLVCSDNQGIVRYGYVYGVDINTVRGKSKESICVGAIVGENTRAGQIYDVYSSVNIIVDRDITHTDYGSVVGKGEGSLRNAYSTGVPVNNMGSAIDPTGENIIGSVSGTNKKSYRNVCYWNETNTQFIKASYQQRVSLENINDYAWQSDILESHFDVQPVEVGYYPHVIWSTDEMPQQEYVPLPSRTNTRIVELLSSEVLSYNEDGTEATVKFRFSNTRNAVITELNVENLSVNLDLDSAVSEDGFTTIMGTLYNPTEYHSRYEVNSIKCSLNKIGQTITYDGETYIKPIINADFYRLIHNPDEWYDYVVCAPTENARLANDIDFTGVSYDRIQVPKDVVYSGNLDGGKVKNADGSYCDYGYSLNNISFARSSYLQFATVFWDVTGTIKNVRVDNYKNTMPTDYMSFVYRLYGTIDNVHMSNIELNGNGYVAGVACRLESGAFLQNSSVNNLKINYTERKNVNSTAYIGGIAGYVSSAKISNCYTTGLDIQANDVKSAEGIGGIVGRVSYGLIENVYASGEAIGRCQNIGGIVGYYESDQVTCDIKNAISHVEVTSYQDSVGGMVGQLKLTNNLINPRNNLSGIAYSNVNCVNVTSENVSYTIGYMSGSNGAMCGSQFQLINGLPEQHLDEEGNLIDTEPTYTLISYLEATDPATYTDPSLLNMDNVFDYSEVSKELIPKLYYFESTKLLPFQPDIRITELRRTDDLLTVSGVYVNENEGYIRITINGPAGYKITEANIELLKYYGLNSENHTTDLVIPENGELALRVFYYPEKEQEHFLDTYSLTKISYISEDGKTIGTSTFNDTPVVIPLMMFGEIKDIPSWNHYLGETNNFGNYENFRVVADIDFSGGASYAVNAKVGRLRGVPSGKDRITLKGITITAGSTNLLFRVNSELSNFSFENVNMQSSGREGVGIVGTSAGTLSNLSFKDIYVEAAKNNYGGIISWQYGGKVENVTLENIEINSRGKVKKAFMGGLVAYSNYGTSFKDITAKNVEVYGDYYVGGVVGHMVGSMENISAEDMIVTGCRYRVGGIAGMNSAARQSNGNSAIMNNISIKGTPSEYDENGRVINSSTVISLDPSQVHATDSYDIGGICGYCSVYYNGYELGTSVDSNNSENPANARAHSVDGVVVKGYGNYIGGAFGRCTDVTNTKVTNTYVGIIKNPEDTYMYMGSVAGYTSYYVRRCDVYNCLVKAFNHYRCGILTGYEGSSLYYCYVENSSLIAEADKNVSMIGFGGICGYNAGALYYSVTKNIVIEANADGMDGVGGITGHTTNQVLSCASYADPIDPSTSPSAFSAYYIKGNRYVGGVIGLQAGSTTQNNYSNVNVIAKNYAGGIVGRYANGYGEAIISGSVRKDYSSIYFYRNYFAGTVEATGDYAGGLIGSLGTKQDNNLDNGREKGVSGSANETAYTFSNLMVAEYVKSAGSNAYAFAGNLDGFEGRANRDGYSSQITTASQRDIAEAAVRDKFAKQTMFWENTQINGVKLLDMLAENAPVYARNVSEHLKNDAGQIMRYAHYAGETTGSTGYRYASSGNGAKLGQYNYDDGATRDWWNVRLVTTSNMDCANMYRSLYFNNRSDYKKCNTLAGNSYRYVILTKDVTSLSAPYTSYCSAAGISYMPHVRYSTDGSSVNDYVTNKQVSEGINVPIPSGYPERTTTFSLLGVSMMPADNYGILYLSDVDRVNLEFGSDLIDSGYYVLKYNGEVVDRQIIRQRVYTYSYDGMANLELCYGNADVGYFKDGHYDYQKEGYLEDFTEESIFDNPDMYLTELGDEVYKAASLRHYIMTNGSKYYYIDEDGLVAGTGSTVVEGDDDESRIVDTSSTISAGEYLSIYNGHALMGDGTVIDVDSHSTIRTVTEGVKCLNNPKAEDYDSELAETIALQNYVLNGISVSTYHMYTDYDGMSNSGQLLISQASDMELIDKDFDNVKDAVAIYTKNGDQYCTVIDNEGYILDMHHGDSSEAINAPEDMKRSGIIYMTNNLNTTAPFILVQYANGGIVGFNYMTGEYLFDNSVENTMDLGEYLKVYFEGDKSQFADMYASYPANKQVADLAITPDRLASMVMGYNTGLVVDPANKNEETYFDPDSEKEVAKLGEVTGDDTKLRDEAGKKNTAEEDDKKLNYDLPLDANTTPVEGKTDGQLSDGGLSTADGESDADGLGGSTTVKPNEGLGLSAGFENVVSPAAEGNNSASGSDKANGDKHVSGSGAGMEKEASTGASAGSAIRDEDKVSTDSGVKEKNKDDITGEDVKEAGKAPSEDEISEQEDKDSKADKQDNADAESEEDKEQSEEAANGSSLESNIVSDSLDNKSADNNEGAEKSESNKSVKTEQTLMVVYNAATGTYEIVDINKYMTDPTYNSENERLAVKDLSVISDYHAEQTETKADKGIWLYLLAIVAVLSGIGAGIFYKKKHNMKV